MQRILVGFVALTGLALVASAQQSRGYAYAFVGPVEVPQSGFTRWEGTFLHAGGGGEGALGDRFGLGGEIGALVPTTNEHGMTTALLSVNPSYHFVGMRSERKLDPFVTAGVSVLVGAGVGALLNYGGGANYWLHKRIGLRVEFRHHIWSPEGEPVHFLGARFGVTFR